MKAGSVHRLAAAAGLAVTAMAALWWLGSTRLEMERGGDPSRSAADAISTLVLVRALLLALSSPSLGALHGARAGALAAALLVAPAWPAVVLAWSASDLAAHRLLAFEVALLSAAMLLPLVGQALGRLVPARHWADLAAVTLGAWLAALVWRAWRAGWLSPLPWA